MFTQLQKINERPELFCVYTAQALWDDEHIARKMLEYHLNPDINLASRNKAFIDSSVAWLIDRFNIKEGTRICDFGCGPGMYTLPLAQHGALVTGIDFSRSSIAYARKAAQDAGLSIEYVLADYLAYTPQGQFDLVTLINYDFCPLSPAQRAALLATMRESLAPGGSLVLDVLSLEYFEMTMEDATYEYAPKGGLWAAGPYFMFQNTFKYERERVVLGKHTIIEEQRIREIYNWLQCYGVDELSRELLDSGFEVQGCLSNVAGDEYMQDSSEIAIIARRPA